MKEEDMRKGRKVAAILGAVAIASVGFASGAQAGPETPPPGFDQEQTMGNSGKTPPNDNAGASEGTKDTSGPKGALKNGNTPDHTVRSSGPGNSQHDR